MYSTTIITQLTARARASLLSLTQHQSTRLLASERAHLPIDLRLDRPAAQYGRITKVSAKCVQKVFQHRFLVVRKDIFAILCKSCNILKHTLLRNHSDLMDIFYSFVFCQNVANSYALYYFAKICCAKKWPAFTVAVHSKLVHMQVYISRQICMQAQYYVVEVLRGQPNKLIYIYLCTGVYSDLCAY